MKTIYLKTRGKWKAFEYNDKIKPYLKRRNIIIGENVVFGDSLSLDSNVQIGNNVKIGNDVDIFDDVTIEDDVIIDDGFIIWEDAIIKADIPNKPLPINEQLEILEEVRNSYDDQNGLCRQIYRAMRKKKHYSSSYKFSSTFIPIFIFKNAKKFGATNHWFWWPLPDYCRFEFLNWMINELKKQIK